MRNTGVGKTTLYNLICETNWDARIARNTVTIY